MTAPRDALFYVDLDAMAQRVGARAEDLLLVWTSESDLRTDLAGSSRTFSTLMHYVATGVMSEGEWDKLPSMTARQQLPYVEKAIWAPAHRVLGRAYRSTFETYLANAAPGLLRPDGTYNPDTVMYAGGNYPDNWPMDNAPAGVNQAIKDGVKISSARGTYEYAKSLVDRGVLKGYVSLGDLQVFGKRVLSSAASGSGTFNTAVTYLRNVRDNVARNLAPSVDAPPPESLTWTPASYTQITTTPAGSSYVPDFDSSFPSGAPRDDRVASPSKARAMAPKHAGGGAPKSIPWGVVGLGALTAAGIALAMNRK